MTAGLYNFTIEQGTDFSRTFSWRDNDDQPINLSGYVATCQIRTSAGALVADFDEDGTITVDGEAGQVTITLPNAFTSTLNFTNASYDLKLTSASDIAGRLIQGVVTLSPGVTQ